MQNKYEVIGVVGEGAYGIVYKCRNKETKEYVAIKKFKEIEDDIVKKSMKRELRMLQILSHENIVEFKEAFKRKSNLFLVFEFVERNLLELLQESPSGLSHSTLKKLIYQLCKAVKYLHEQNVVHRDIKPENLLISSDLKLKLCDFGFARKYSMTSKENLTDYVATRWYRSPELLITNGFYGPEVDYWAIGCIMGELADGNPLFPGDNEEDQLHCIQKVLGNLPEEQIEMFYKNPIYAGKSLLNVEKPETLERRFMGKLPKIAIDFMKGLLMLDPKKRLCGEEVFEHPYFENYLDDKKGNKLITKVLSTPEIRGKGKKKIKVQSPGKEVNEKDKEKENNTMINTTNINIINYNMFTDLVVPNNQNSGRVNNNIINNIEKQINLLTDRKMKNTPIQLDKKPKINYVSMSMPKMGRTMNENFRDLKGKKLKLNFNKQKTLLDTNNQNSLYLNKNITNTPIIEKDNLLGYKTFFSNKNNNDKYNFNINTYFPKKQNLKAKINFKQMANQNMVIEEEDEYSNYNHIHNNNNNIINYLNEETKKKSNSMMKTNTNLHKIGMYFNGQKELKNKNIINHKANISYYGMSFAKRNNSFILPTLGKSHNVVYNNKGSKVNMKYYI